MMIIIKRCWTLYKVDLVGSVLMLGLMKNSRKSPGIIKLRVLESQIPGEIPSQCNPLTTQPQMRFVKRWLR